MQRTILKTIDMDEQVSMCMGFAAPKAMTSGKCGWRIWQAACDFAGMLRGRVPTRIVINFYLQGGLHTHQFSRWMQSRHEMLFELEPSICEREPLAKELDWTIAMRCASHCASSGIKWGLHPFLSEQLLDDVSISILSLQNSSSELLKVVPLFVRTRLVFEEVDSHIDIAARRSLWHSLGVPEKNHASCA